MIDPISIASYCAFARPGKVVFRRFSPDTPFKVGVIYPADRPRSLITSAFADHLRQRIQTLEQVMDDFLAWGKQD